MVDLLPKSSVVNIKAFLEMPDLRFSTESLRNIANIWRFSINFALWYLFIILNQLIASNWACHSSGSFSLACITSQNLAKSVLKIWSASKSKSSSNCVYVTAFWSSAWFSSSDFSAFPASSSFSMSCNQINIWSRLTFNSYQLVCGFHFNILNVF